MKVLFLSPRPLWPLTSGAKLREYHFARALGRKGDLTHVHFEGPHGGTGDDDRFPFIRRRLGVPPPRLYTPRKLLSGLVGRWPLPAANYWSKEMARTLVELSAERFDLIHIDAVQLVGHAPLLKRYYPGVPVIYDWHNIESELMRRYGANVRSLPRKLYAAMTARRLETMERFILGAGAGHVVCSERERLHLLQVAPGVRVEVVPNGVDIAAFGEAAPPLMSRDRLVFVGSMQYHANAEAALSFARGVWPQLRRRFPNWKLTLVGSDPPAEVRALAGEERVEVTGTVDDVRPYYRQAVAAVVPLLTGSGTRLKILEAMAARVPVISTTVGAEGLEVVPGRNILMANSEPEWLAALDTLSAGKAWHSIAQAARDLVERHYDWEMLGERLYRTYQGWTCARAGAAAAGR